MDGKFSDLSKFVFYRFYTRVFMELITILPMISRLLTTPATFPGYLKRFKGCIISSRQSLKVHIIENQFIFLNYNYACILPTILIKKMACKRFSKNV